MCVCVCECECVCPVLPRPEVEVLRCCCLMAGNRGVVCGVCGAALDAATCAEYCAKTLPVLDAANPGMPADDDDDEDDDPAGGNKDDDAGDEEEG